MEREGAMQRRKETGEEREEKEESGREGEKEGQGRERDLGEGGRRQMEEEKAQSWATPGHSGEEAIASHFWL